MLFSTYKHRYCAKHICNNFKVDRKSLELKDALWKCANNLSESFNAMILEAKNKPILVMLEWIRVRLMTKQYKKIKGKGVS